MLCDWKIRFQIIIEEIADEQMIQLTKSKHCQHAQNRQPN